MRTAPLSIHSLFNYESEYNTEEQNCQLSFQKKQMFFQKFLHFEIQGYIPDFISS